LNAPRRAAGGRVPRFRGRCGDRVARLTIGPSDGPRITTARAHLCLRTGAVGRWSAPSRARGSATSDAEGMASATPGTGWTMPSPPSLPPPLPSGRLEDLTHYSQPTPGRNVGSRYSQPSCQANSSATTAPPALSSRCDARLNPEHRHFGTSHSRTPTTTLRPRPRRCLDAPPNGPLTQRGFDLERRNRLGRGRSTGSSAPAGRAPSDDAAPGAWGRLAQER
jgi:hypothetical protein